jgi:hypothetical protein
MGFMATQPGHTLLVPGDPRWESINAEQAAEQDIRARALTVAERLDRGIRLSRTAADLRRAAWEAQRGRPAA